MDQEGKGGKQGFHCSKRLQVILPWLQIKVEREAELSKQHAWFTCTCFPARQLEDRLRASACSWTSSLYVSSQEELDPGKLAEERHQHQRSAYVRGWGRGLSWQRTNLNLMTTIFKNQSEYSVLIAQWLKLAAYSVQKNQNVVCNDFFWSTITIQMRWTSRDWIPFSVDVVDHSCSKRRRDIRDVNSYLTT